MKFYLLFIVLIMVMSNYASGQVSYVTPEGAGLKNGTNWSNAYDSSQLQHAIDEAAVSTTEIWVSAGTYKSGNLTTSYFYMKSGVAIYGGFAGNEIVRDARNWVSNVTILSGDHGDPRLKTDNSIHVIYNDSVNSTGILDGFTIKDGFNGIGQGGAGGGIFNRASSPTINNCIITGNTGSFGGGIFNTNSSSPLITNVIITNNSSRRGGAMTNNASSPTLINCKITNNTASVNGGAIFNESSPTSPTFINCTISNNTASTYGGAVCNELATPVFYNSIVWDNSASLGGSEFYIESGTITLDYSCYTNELNSVLSNSPTGATFTATNSINQDPMFISVGEKDFLIAGNSPCADAGLDTYNNLENDLRGAGFGRKLNKSTNSIGTIDMGAYEYKFGTDPVSGINYTWLGTTDTDWNTVSNWSPAALPTSIDEVTIHGGASNYPLINNIVNCYKLAIASGGSLTMATTGAITVTDEIANNGTITILSNATGTGSLIAGSATGTGTVTAQRYLPANAWTMVSSPLSGQTIASFLTLPINAVIETNGTGRGMMDYNPALDTWNSFFTNSTVKNIGGGQGFSIRLEGSSDASVTFNGTLRAGPLSVITVLDKWNCVGNPYTSAIGMTSRAGSPENFLTRNSSNLDPAYGVYIWDRSNGGNEITGQFTAISNVPSPTTSGFNFQSGQAFMVKMKPKVAGISFNRSMQIHDPGLALKSVETDWPIINLVVKTNNQKSSTIIGFNTEMSKGLDPTYDAGLYKGGSDLSLYTYLLEGINIPFAIQALPDNQYDNMIIPVGLDYKSGGTVAFSAELFNLPKQGHAFLEDQLTKIFTDLSKDVYTTTIDANTSVSDRFRLHASPLTVTGVINKTRYGQLSAYPVRNTEIRVSGSVSNLAIVTLYDIQGKVVLIKNLEQGILNTIQIPNLKPGIYLLSVKDNQHVQRFKIPISK